eukprot:XP_001703374.1 predicted protein [Chlamydomonas reinhardtii]
MAALNYARPIELNPAGEHKSTMIMLHGLGDTGDGWSDIGYMYKSSLPNTKFIFPHAPRRPITINFGMSMPGWYDIASLEEVNRSEDAEGLQESKRLDERGVIAKDNSGRQNIFPTSSKAYYSSPTSSAVASSGLGGQQGLGVLAAAFAIVALATAGVVLKQGDETLAQVNNAYQGDSLTVISSRIAESL